MTALLSQIATGSSDFVPPDGFGVTEMRESLTDLGERRVGPATLLSTQEVAAIFGLSVKTVVGWVSDGAVAAVRVPNAGRRPALLRFDPDEVERFRADQVAAREARRALAARRAAERVERARVRRERPASRRRWSDQHREEIDADGMVCRGGRFMARFPVEPLFALFPGDPILRLSRTTGVDNGQLHRAIRDGLTWSSADRWAVALGFHPAEVWGQAWWSLD